MKIVIALDSYKECLSSREVAAAMADAVLQAGPSAEVVQIPFADGGEGTLDVLAGALGAKIQETRVSDPLGRTIDARFATLGDTGIIEARSIRKQQPSGPSEVCKQTCYSPLGLYGYSVNTGRIENPR